MDSRKIFKSTLCLLIHLGVILAIKVASEIEDQSISITFRRVGTSGFCSDGTPGESTARRFGQVACAAAQTDCERDAACVALACSNANRVSVFYTTTDCTEGCGNLAWVQNSSHITGTMTDVSQPYWNDAECYVKDTTSGTAGAVITNVSEVCNSSYWTAQEQMYPNLPIEAANFTIDNVSVPFTIELVIEGALNRYSQLVRVAPVSCQTCFGGNDYMNPLLSVSNYMFHAELYPGGIGFSDLQLDFGNGNNSYSLKLECGNGACSSYSRGSAISDWVLGRTRAATRFFKETGAYKVQLGLPRGEADACGRIISFSHSLLQPTR
jgi:hypothetical protein